MLGLFRACVEAAHTVAGKGFLEDKDFLCYFGFPVHKKTTNGPIVWQCQMLGALQVLEQLENANSAALSSLKSCEQPK